MDVITLHYVFSAEMALVGFRLSNVQNVLVFNEKI